MNTLVKLRFSYFLDISGEAKEMLGSQKGMCHMNLVITFSSA